MKYCSTSIFILISTLISCSQPVLEKDEYIQWIISKDNDVKDNRSVGDYFFYLQYQLPEWIFLQRNSNSSITGHEMKLAIDEISSLQYYTLTIGLNDGNEDFINSGSPKTGEIEKRIYYFSYSFQEDISLKEDGKRILPVLFHFERSMDVKNSRTFVMGFENTNSSLGKISFIIESPFFGSVPIELSINKNNAKKLKL